MNVKRFDRGELRRSKKMPNGWLRVDAFITRTGVFTYRNTDGSIRRELRLPEEVFNQDSLDSFAQVPVTNDHPTVFLDASNSKAHASGAVGDNVFKDGEFVRASLMVHDSQLVGEMENRKKVEVSCGYICDLENKPGVYQGQPYDVIQRNIRGNHVAIVPKGRAGPDVRVRLDGDAPAEAFAVQEEMMTVAEARKDFDPDQPRDENGRFGSGGGGGGGSGEGKGAGSSRPDNRKVRQLENGNFLGESDHGTFVANSEEQVNKMADEAYDAEQRSAAREKASYDKPIAERDEQDNYNAAAHEAKIGKIERNHKVVAKRAKELDRETKAAKKAAAKAAKPESKAKAPKAAPVETAGDDDDEDADFAKTHGIDEPGDELLPRSEDFNEAAESGRDPKEIRAERVKAKVEAKAKAAKPAKAKAPKAPKAPPPPSDDDDEDADFAETHGIAEEGDELLPRSEDFNEAAESGRDPKEIRAERVKAKVESKAKAAKPAPDDDDEDADFAKTHGEDKPGDELLPRSEDFNEAAETGRDPKEIRAEKVKAPKAKKELGPRGQAFLKQKALAQEIAAKARAQQESLKEAAVKQDPVIGTRMAEAKATNAPDERVQEEKAYGEKESRRQAVQAKIASKQAEQRIAEEKEFDRNLAKGQVAQIKASWKPMPNPNDRIAEKLKEKQGSRWQAGSDEDRARVLKVIASSRKKKDSMENTETKTDTAELKLDVADYEAFAVDLQVRFDSQTSELETLKAKLDSLTAELKTAQDALATTAGKARADMKAEMELQARAREVLGTEAKLDGMDAKAIKVAVIQKLSPSFKADSASDTYVDARFDIELEKRADSAGAQALGQVRAAVVSASHQDSANSADAARARMIQAGKEAWKKPLAASK